MVNGGDLIAQVLKSQCVKFLFTLCGGHISPILVGAKKEGIRVVDVRQEPTAIFAADAIARLTGIPGVAAVTAGPGVTNSITAIKNAQMAQSPLILLGGAAATVLKGRGALQDIEQIELYRTITKWSVSIIQDCDIIPILEEAFEVAKSGIPGPVFVECPIDLLYDEELVREWYGAKSGVSKPKNLVDRAIKWYLRKHVDKMFACSDKSIELSKSDGIQPFEINPKKLEEAQRLLNSAEKPILLIGSQTLLDINSINKLIEAIEILNIPTFLAGMARGLLGKSHRLYRRHNRTEALRETDLVILAGMPMDFRLNYGRAINRNASLITVNRDRKALKKNRKPTLGIQADSSKFLINLSKITKKSDNWDEWLDLTKSRNEQREQEINEQSKIETDYINPLYLCKEIDKILDDNSIIIGDGGDFIATASYIVKPRQPLSWLDPGPFGTLGVGAGFALAAKLVHPEKEVWLMYGDGAAGYSLIEFDTFVRHNLPIISVIGNDAGWTQISRDQIEYLKDDVGTVLTHNNYQEIVNGLGAKGLLLKESNNIEETLTLAIKLSKEGTPVLINALIGKTDFRKGSISM